MIETILMVCAGNICRSPMAEGILKGMLPDRTVTSAGMSAVIGHAADPHAIELMRIRGIDISAHRGQQLARWHCLGADMILTMERGQKAMIEQWLPLVRGRVFRVGEFFDVDIADPYRQGRRGFERALESIEVGLGAWASKMEGK
jgi:protein-tyrosine phosphatase